jgi:hypothetical protein
MTSLGFDLFHKYPDDVPGIDLPIRLRAGNQREVRLTAKLDTGSTHCIFARDYAEQLGLSVEDGVEKSITTATGSFITYEHRVTLLCFGWDIDCTVCFAANEEFQRNVLGRVGWLQQFRVGIVDYESTIYLSPYSK